MSELKKCPFCGGEAKYYTDCDMTQVQCAVCGATPSGWWDEAEDAAAEWNRRAPSCDHQQYAESCADCGFCAQPENAPPAAEEGAEK